MLCVEIDAEDELGTLSLVCDPDISWYVRYFGAFGALRRSVNSRNRLGNNEFVSMLQVSYIHQENLKWPDIIRELAEE